jgi:DNA-3-methyladenine glycosylase II
MYTITPQGPFSLAESARFAYIDREPEGNGTGLRLGFCRDRTWEPTAVSVSQQGSTVEVDGDATSRAQVERILGLNVDASTFADVGNRDPIIGRLQAEAPGLRPPSIHSAYEAAVFCILTARRSGAQARHMRSALAQQAGTVLNVAGQHVTCLPPPSSLLDPPPVRGLDPVRRERLTAVARAALDGRLDTAELAAMPPEEARKQLEQLPGIGPFSSAIVVVRALGHTDYMAGPITELNAIVGRLYDLGHDATAGQLQQISQPWAPWRTWAQLYIRSVSTRLVASGR